MLDAGSPRVYNCNEMTRRVTAQHPENTPAFFRTKALNNIVVIKDTVPESERRLLGSSVGTKLYFPFNEQDIYEGGRTIFLHGKGIDRAIEDYCGEGAITKESLAADLAILNVLNQLPSLDPFLMKDAFLRAGIDIHEAYFEVSAALWEEIENYMLQKFEPLIMAAFPNAKSSDEIARQLIDKIWEGKDIEALMPLITAFRIPKERALEIFSAWKGIVYYSYQFGRDQNSFFDLIKWVGENSAPAVGVPAAEMKELEKLFTLTRTKLRQEWKTVDEIIKNYQESYDKMFKEQSSSAGFLSFLQNSDKTYWEVGNALGKINHAIYCWDVMTSRYDDRKVPWANRLAIARLFGEILAEDKKSTTSVAWG